MFNQLIQPRLANYFSNEKIHFLFCSSLIESPVPFSHNHYAPLIMCPKKNTPNKKHEIPSAPVTASKLKKSTQQSSIRTFLKKDLTSTVATGMQILVENMITHPNILIPFFMVIQIQS